MTGSSIPYVHKQGDIINWEKENANHSYLQNLALYGHNHGIFGNGGNLENATNTGTFVTDEMKVGEGISLETLLGTDVYISDWVSISTTETDFVHNKDNLPKIMQVHISSSAYGNPPSKFQSAVIDHTSDRRGFTWFVGVGTFGRIKDTNTVGVRIFTNYTRHADWLWVNTNAGTIYFPLYDDGNMIARVVCLF